MKKIGIKWFKHPTKEGVIYPMTEMEYTEEDEKTLESFGNNPMPCWRCKKIPEFIEDESSWRRKCECGSGWSFNKWAYKDIAEVVQSYNRDVLYNLQRSEDLSKRLK